VIFVGFILRHGYTSSLAMARTRPRYNPANRERGFAENI
jgi:hypothetical protein